MRLARSEHYNEFHITGVGGKIRFWCHSPHERKVLYILYNILGLANERKTASETLHYLILGRNIKAAFFE